VAPDVPGANGTGDGAIKDRAHAFVLSHPHFVTFEANGDGHGVVLDQGKFATSDMPGAIITLAFGINDLGEVVGPDRGRHAAQLRRATLATLTPGDPIKEEVMQFHDVDVKTQFKRMRELVPETYRAFLEFDQKAFKDGAIPGKTKELIALGIAQITQCPWCIDAHTKKAATAGASDAEIAETTFVAMAMAAGAAWSHGGLALQCLQEHKG